MPDASLVMYRSSCAGVGLGRGNLNVRYARARRIRYRNNLRDSLSEDLDYNQAKKHQRTYSMFRSSGRDSAPGLSSSRTCSYHNPFYDMDFFRLPARRNHAKVQIEPGGRAPTTETVINA